MAPDFIGSGNYSSFYFSGYGHNYTRFSFAGAAKEKVNQARLLSSISANMPKWAFMYLAPKQVALSEKNKNPVPFVLDQGEHLYFVMPE